MDEKLDAGEGEQPQVPPAERERDRMTQARLAYRLQHLKTMWDNRQTQEPWELSRAAEAREQYIRQREAAREHTAREREERAQRRLQEYWAREVAARQRTDQGTIDNQAIKLSQESPDP